MAKVPPGIDPAFAAQFQKIQQAFVAGLPQRLLSIEQTSDANTRHVALHRLAGAAGGYGLDALSVLAREAMHAQQAGHALLFQTKLAQLAQAIREHGTSD